MAVTTSYSRSILYPDGDIGAVNTQTVGDNLFPDVVITSDGDALLTYDAPALTSGDVAVNYLADDGTQATFGDTLNTTTTGVQDSARSTVLSNGDIVVVFEDDPGGTDTPNIRAQILDSTGIITSHLGNGSLGTDDFVIQDKGSDGLFDPAVAAFDGGFMSVWVDDTNGNRIEGRTFANNGVLLDNYILLSDSGATIDASAPQIAALSDNTFVVAWIQNDNGGLPQVKARIYDPVAQTAATSIITVASGGTFSDVHVAANTTGGFVIAFTQDSGAASRIKMGEYNSVGGLISGGDLTESGSGTSVTDLLHTGNDTWVVAYNDIFSPTDTDAKIKVVEKTGSTLITELTVNVAFSLAVETGMALASYGDGRFIGVFEDATADGNGIGIGAEIFSLTRTSTGDGGDDTIVGDDMIDIISGGDGINEMTGAGGNDQITGGSSFDYFYATMNDGDDTYTGAGGRDFLVYSAITSSITANLTTRTISSAQTGTDTLGDDFEDFTGGSAADDITGNDLDNGLDGRGGIDTMRGGLGNDTYYIDTLLDVLIENPGEGSDSVVTVFSYTLLDNFENMYLSSSAGAINGTGNALDNQIFGNDFANEIDGKGGADIMSGGIGHDTYIVDNPGDVVIEDSGEGIDTINSFVSYELPDDVENLSLLGTGGLGATGNGLANTLIGNSGNNTLDGRGNADNMLGGLGDDTYVVDNAGDSVSEGAGEGTDQVNSSVGFTLFANLEHLSLLGSSDINGIGNELDNNIFGNSGNNTLDGLTGADDMRGGDGDDIYVVDNVGDQVSDNAGPTGGTDQVNSHVGFTLFSYLENLSLLGTSDINGIGNELDNEIFGNSGNNTLDGLTGADDMRGGDGDDIYVVDNVGDQVSDNAGPSGGTDQVNSSVSFTLFAYLENLSLLGTADIDAIGNSEDNVLIGNAGNNTLDGLGGADTMIGNAGDDIFVVDNVGDVVSDNPGASGGVDQVNSSVSFTLFANLENLSLLGSGNIDATGNELDNNLFGNSGNNRFLGNAGNDLLIGNGGNDTYVFGDGAGNDTITDFSAGPGAGDVLDITAFGFADFSAVLAATDDSGGTGPTVIQLDGNDSVTLQGVVKADLAADDFILS